MKITDNKNMYNTNKCKITEISIYINTVIIKCSTNRKI